MSKNLWLKEIKYQKETVVGISQEKQDKATLIIILKPLVIQAT